MQETTMAQPFDSVSSGSLFDFFESKKKNNYCKNEFQRAQWNEETGRDGHSEKGIREFEFKCNENVSDSIAPQVEEYKMIIENNKDVQKAQRKSYKSQDNFSVSDVIGSGCFKDLSIDVEATVTASGSGTSLSSTASSSSFVSFKDEIESSPEKSVKSNAAFTESIRECTEVIFMEQDVNSLMELTVTTEKRFNTPPPPPRQVSLQTNKSDSKKLTTQSNPRGASFCDLVSSDINKKQNLSLERSILSGKETVEVRPGGCGDVVDTEKELIKKSDVSAGAIDIVHNIESTVEHQHVSHKDHSVTEQNTVRASINSPIDDNGNSRQNKKFDNNSCSSSSSDSFECSDESSESLVKVEHAMSENSLSYKDDFEGSANETPVSKNEIPKDVRKPATPHIPKSFYTNRKFCPPHLNNTDRNIVGGKERVALPHIHTKRQVQLTSLSCSSEQFLPVYKTRASRTVANSESNETFVSSSMPYSQKQDSWNETNMSSERVRDFPGRVPINLKASAVYMNGQLEVTITDDQEKLQSSERMDVRITLVHKHMNRTQHVKKKPRVPIPKLHFGTNKDIIRQRAMHPPMNTHVDAEASERHRKFFGSQY